MPESFWLRIEYLVSDGAQNDVLRTVNRKKKKKAKAKENKRMPMRALLN